MSGGGQPIAGICELVLETGDLERLAAFYEGLGMKVLDRDDDRIWLKAGPESRLGIWSPGEKEHGDRGGAHVHFALSVGRGELTEIAERLSGEGVAVEGPVEHPGGDISVYFDDPEGNRVELWDFFRDGDGAEEGADAFDD